ncbi:hypothetical protein CPT_Madawaska_158 [Staphylococcus phage Madawaska]|nr:hypothetical protein CPT_Madawaska_158 [Staphylococcus phage Madawaska]
MDLKSLEESLDKEFNLVNEDPDQDFFKSMIGFIINQYQKGIDGLTKQGYANFQPSKFIYMGTNINLEVKCKNLVSGENTERDFAVVRINRVIASGGQYERIMNKNKSLVFPELKKMKPSDEAKKAAESRIKKDKLKLELRKDIEDIRNTKDRKEKKRKIKEYKEKLKNSKKKLNEELNRDIDTDKEEPICEECGSKMSPNESGQLVCEDCGNTSDVAVQEGIVEPDTLEADFAKACMNFKIKAKSKGIRIDSGNAVVVAKRTGGKNAALEVPIKYKGKDKIRRIPIGIVADRFKEAQKWAQSNGNKFVSIFKKAPDKKPEIDEDDKVVENLEKILDEEFNLN